MPDGEGRFVLAPSKEWQTVCATDRAGNVTEIKVLINDGHSYQWKNDNRLYWKQCSVCGVENDKKEIPVISVTGADVVCATHEYTAEVILPEDIKNPSFGYRIQNGTNGNPAVVQKGNVYNLMIPSEVYIENGRSLIVCVTAETVDGYEVTADKTVEILTKHRGGTAYCTTQANCDICGVNYGDTDSHNHKELRHHEAKAATFTTTGNIEYWECEDCNKYFADKEADKEIRIEDTLIPEEKGTEKEEKIEQEDFTEGKASEKKSKKNIVLELEKEPGNKETLMEESENNSTTPLYSPRTGDNNKVILLFVLLAVSGSVLMVRGIWQKKEM